MDEEPKRYPNIEICYILTKFEEAVKGDLLYSLNCIKQVFLINTGKVVILNDSNYMVSHFKRSQVRVFQVWYACGVVKKSDNETDRQYEMKNYDYVLLTSDQWKPIYAKAFSVNEHQMPPLGMPRMGVLFSRVCRLAYRNELLERYPVLQGKYVILYTPTFRGNIIKGPRHMDLNLSSLIERLPDHYVVMYKMHPLLRDVDLRGGEWILSVADEELNHLYMVTDCLIMDHPSILFDLSIMKKKATLYTPDLAEHGETLGFNTDLKSIPFPVCQTAENLTKEFCTKDYGKKSIKTLKDTYFMHQGGENIERVNSFICQWLKQS